MMTAIASSRMLLVEDIMGVMRVGAFESAAEMIRSGSALHRQQVASFFPLYSPPDLSFTFVGYK